MFPAQLVVGGREPLREAICTVERLQSGFGGGEGEADGIIIITGAVAQLLEELERSR